MKQINTTSKYRWYHERKLIKAEILSLEGAVKTYSSEVVLIEYYEHPILHVFISPQRIRLSRLIRTYKEIDAIGEPDVGIVLNWGRPVYYITHMTDIPHLQEIIITLQDATQDTPNNYKR